MEKCSLCKERCDADPENEPMCVVCCPSSARIYGDLDDPDSEISKIVKQSNAYTLLEGKGTRPQVYYHD
jgi:molybdopterin-containing oxidoreductase family iron-sulfur binding subunit